uniref:HAT C-terminal dimerisation domain-containing protein n=1 Tax=Lactuca sativa TaxID=4236 RepID=A0A9R1VIG3_LACSA|nr:hypothetical protein LSAT_V11C500246490 [Lactuca sativa]
MIVRYRETKSPGKFQLNVLSLTCSATSCERNWSVFQHVSFFLHLHKKTRNRLTQERLNDIVFVKFNSSLERQTKDKENDHLILQDINESNM